MKIDSVTNTNFTGIKLSNSNPFVTKTIVKNLKKSGFNYFGNRTYDIVNCSDKFFVFEDIRFRNDFSMRNFGVVFLPDETYIVADHYIEQLMLPVVKKIDKNAGINLLL